MIAHVISLGLAGAVAVLEGVAAQLCPLPLRLNVRLFNYIF